MTEDSLQVLRELHNLPPRVLETSSLLLSEGAEVPRDQLAASDPIDKKILS